MSNPWLSIVTITKDDPAGLRRTLASAEHWRTVSGVEQVLVYAGPPPSGSDAERLKIVAQTSSGIAGAFNEGLAAAAGDWIWFVNGGDAIHEALSPDWLRALLCHTAADVITGALLYDGDPIPQLAPPISRQWPMSSSWLPHPATLIRRRVLQEVKGFDPRWKVCMDFDLWYRLLGRDVVTDVLAIPLARFAGGGISREETNVALIYSENAAVLWRHKRVVARAWLRQFRLITKALLRGLKYRSR